MRIEPLKEVSPLDEATKACARIIAIQNQAGIDTSDSYVSGAQVLKVIELAEEQHLRHMEKLNEVIEGVNELIERIERLEAR